MQTCKSHIAKFPKLTDKFNMDLTSQLNRKTKSKGDYEEVSSSEQRNYSECNEYDLEFPDNLDGPVQQRTITDPLFCLLLLCSWIASGGLGYWALMHGDPAKLIRPFE